MDEIEEVELGSYACALGRTILRFRAVLVGCEWKLQWWSVNCGRWEPADLGTLDEMQALEAANLLGLHVKPEW